MRTFEAIECPTMERAQDVAGLRGLRALVYGGRYLVAGPDLVAALESSRVQWAWIGRNGEGRVMTVPVHD